MWTSKSHWVLVYVQVKRIPIPAIVPLRILFESIEALEDLLLLCGRFVKSVDAHRGVQTLWDVAWEVSSLKRFDLVEVETGDKVKIRMCLR